VKKIIVSELDAHCKTAYKMDGLVEELVEVTDLCIHSLKNGGKILLFGNGGSAADAQHIAAEFVGRYKRERKGLPAIALTTDSSILTCISNDYHFEYVFSRQVETLANKVDVVIGISTSGNSLNVVNGLKSAKEIGCTVIGFTGCLGGEFDQFCNVNLVVPSSDTARIQEMHILIGHIICRLIDEAFTTN